MNNEINFVNEKIHDKEYTILSDNIAINNVYKIKKTGNLLEDGYEFGYLYIPTGSGIKPHTHTENIERYKLISGSLTVNNEPVYYNICTINESHNINIVPTPTIIQTCKIDKNFLHLLKNQTNEEFETFVTNILNKNY